MNRIIANLNRRRGVMLLHEGQIKEILVGDIVRTGDGKLHEITAIADGSDTGAAGNLLTYSLDGTPNILSPSAVSKIYRETR